MFFAEIKYYTLLRLSAELSSTKGNPSDLPSGNIPNCLVLLLTND